MAKFVYNNSPHTATGVSPFFANKGYHLRLSIDLARVKDSEANQVAKDLKSLQEYLKICLTLAN